MLYTVVRSLHVVGIIVWLGAGLGHPVIADIRRTLELGGGVHGPPLMDRLKTTSRVVIPAAVVSLATGFAMIVLRGGFALVPVRIHIGLTLALAVFAVGGAFTSRAMKALGDSFEADDLDAARGASRRIVVGLRIEDALRAAALLTMVVPVESWVK